MRLNFVAIENRLVSITKQGNTYLRKLLIHGARSALATSATPLD